MIIVLCHLVLQAIICRKQAKWMISRLNYFCSLLLSVSFISTRNLLLLALNIGKEFEILAKLISYHLGITMQSRFHQRVCLAQDPSVFSSSSFPFRRFWTRSATFNYYPYFYTKSYTLQIISDFKILSSNNG